MMHNESKEDIDEERDVAQNVDSITDHFAGLFE